MMELSDKIAKARGKLMGMGCGIGAGTMSGVLSRQGQTKWMGRESEHPNENPFKSEKQRKFLYSQKPAVAKKFAAHSKKGGM